MRISVQVAKFLPLFLIALISLLISTISLLVSRDLGQSIALATLIWALPNLWYRWRGSKHLATNNADLLAKDFYSAAVGRFVLSIMFLAAVLLRVDDLQYGSFFGYWLLLLISQPLIFYKVDTKTN